MTHRTVPSFHSHVKDRSSACVPAGTPLFPRGTQMNPRTIVAAVHAPNNMHVTEKPSQSAKIPPRSIPARLPIRYRPLYNPMK